ncbi:MAG TPA: hypothetical protein H9728_05640 [Candidatus Borkfalkia excrementavium]|uniref:Uncharacterized protein n=1 Tax=Candidatus Borkfalkia excrementavium TaxID=2838505 RepID=A0A9D2CF62_9FIRM|nr:hypothetical protein [Candidatus Borkfalkia excrementavium]
MDTDMRQIDAFLQKCDEVMQSKFIIADTKISDLLKSIASSDLLYAFFREATKNFDYPAAQKKYMNYMPEGTAGKRKLLFPEDPEERLAFVFCLLVDFDNKRIDLSDFLSEYFYEDGSVYESFYAFCNQVIKPFKNAVKVMFRGWQAPRAESSASENFSDLVSREREKVFASRLSDRDKVDGMLILNALAAADRSQETIVAGLLGGYRCFVAKTRFQSESTRPLLDILADLEARL